MDFVKFNSIPRFYREWRVTEKIDGTNACVAIATLDGSGEPSADRLAIVHTSEGNLGVWAGSRSRWHGTEKATDNHGFAKWVAANCDDLAMLGPGYHFGEWWGQGIQRGYGLTEKRLTLFYPPRHGEIPDCISGLVPEIVLAAWSDVNDLIHRTSGILTTFGSRVAPGYMNPEGIVIQHVPSRAVFKYTFDGDGHKSEAKRAA